MLIDELISKVECQIGRDDAFAFLPEIRDTLATIKQSAVASREARSRLAAGLERLILEDYQFSESKLGHELLGFSNRYVQAGIV